VADDVENADSLIENADSLSVACKVCDAFSTLWGEAEILGKHRVKYFRCTNCGFIQTETPYWLEEAYSTAITRLDVGLMRRNLVNCELTSAVLNLLFPKASNAVDFGAGHGVFVRLMRDKGFNFSWFDRYATNDYARGFEYKEGSKYDLLTAFEVLEHLVDPVSEISALMDISDNVFVSTCIVPEPVPALSDWWYYSQITGQHIAFYTRESLRILAARFGRTLVSHGAYHLFSREPQSEILFRLATKLRVARNMNRMYRRPSLINHDFEQMAH
jgi:hypothetical protein